MPGSYAFNISIGYSGIHLACTGPASDPHSLPTSFPIHQSIQHQHRGEKEVRKAFEFALVAHGSQRRKSGEPYITHPLEVARICFEEMGLGFKSVIGALLHDVVEDTPVTLEQVRLEFGPKIALIVDGLTKLDGLYNVESPQAENFKKFSALWWMMFGLS